MDQETGLQNLFPIRIWYCHRGTRLRREWKGKTYEVIVRDDGSFEYNGEIYRSLSSVASGITGTHWNGKKFFGVK